MLSFLMGKRKRRGERSRMGNNHSKIEENGQGSGAVKDISVRGRGNETNLTDDEKGSENLTEAVPVISSTNELSEVPREAENPDLSTPDTFAKTTQESDKTFAITVQDLPVEHTYRILDEITPKMDSPRSNQDIIGGATNEIEENGEKVKDSGSSSVGLNPTESPITCHEREQVLRITRVHSLDSSSEDPRGLNQSSSPSVEPVVVTKCDDGRGAGKSAAKTLTDLEKSRKAFFMGLLEETVEEIYPEDVKYVETPVVVEHSQHPPDPPLERLQISTNCAVSDESTIDCSEINTVETLDNVVDLTHGELIAKPEELQSMSSIVCDLDDPTNSIVPPTLNSITLEFKNPLEENFVEETCREEGSSYETTSYSDLGQSKHDNDSEEDTQKYFEETYDDVTESKIVTDIDGIIVLTTEEKEHSDMECDDEESGIVGNSDALSLNEVSLTNTIDERVTDSGLENPDLDDVLHTELDDISLEEFETAGCEASESISIDLVITEVKCDGLSGQAPEVVIEKLENGPENRAEDPGQSGNDVKLDEVGNCVETGEGESDDRPRGGLGTGLPGPRRGLIAPVHCAIPRDEHRVDMLTLSNGTYETFPRSNLSLASSSDESIGTKVKKHVRWADTDEGKSLESYDSYSSCSSSEDEESGSEDEGRGVDQELEVARDVPADVNEDDDEDDTSDSDEESESDEEDNKTGADDTFTESDISVVNLESANESNDDKLEEDECDEDEDEEEEVEEKMEADETETKTEENLVETITRLQEELLTKAASLERAQSDLDAAFLEADKARRKIERLQEELDSLKRRNADLQNSIESGSLTCEAKEQLESQIRKLENELQSVKSERNRLESRLSSLEQERDQEIRMVQRALEETMKEQTEREAKYQKEFETERTLSSQRELQMLEDFEWKLRETEKNAKKKVEGAETEAAKRIHDMEAKLVRAEADLERLAELKLCEIELKQLKVTSSEQRRTLRQVTRQFEELQVNEKILQEEVNRLRLALDKEKLTVTNLQTIHKEELAEKDRKHRVKLEVQVSQITSEWEDRLRRELAKLKGNLENTHREEKIVAVDMVKLLKEQEIAALKQGWEKKVKEFKDEIANYKQKLEAMENSHKEEIENAQTCSDRDALDLRRKMDKLDMEYQSKIEKMQEQHEAELNDLRQECERKILQIDSTYQLQAGTTRTTIELVKQQMMNENQSRIDRLQAMHIQQMEEQWAMLDLERRNEVRGLEDAHRAALEQLRKELDEIRKAVTPTGGKQSNRQRTPIPESAKQMVIEQLNHEATNPYSCGSLDGIEAVSAGSDAEKILFAKLQQLTRQANEDKAEIERLRLRLEEKECVNTTQHTTAHQQQQQQQRGQQHPPHPTRRNRKRRN
uniref:Uncharacterized protein n=1 Tax=Lygus hesperus TaxID=30085 RepID=A0A0K8TEE2_LYGHE